MTTTHRDIFIGSSGPNSQPAFFSSDEKMYKIKTVLVGDVNVGKTSLAVRFVKDRFEEGYKPTIGASFISKTAIIGDGCVINFQLWDTAGQERYRSLVPMYLRGAHIAFVVYDVTNPESFANVAFWLDALQHHGDMIKTVLVANKSDLESVVDESVALSLAEEHHLQFVTTSAKTGENVDEMFQTIGANVVDKMKKESRSHNANDRISIFSSQFSNASLEDEERDSRGNGKKRKKCC